MILAGFPDNEENEVHGSSDKKMHDMWHAPTYLTNFCSLQAEKIFEYA